MQSRFIGKPRETPRTVGIVGATVATFQAPSPPSTLAKAPGPADGGVGQLATAPGRQSRSDRKASRTPPSRWVDVLTDGVDGGVDPGGYGGSSATASASMPK
jgi:hypothetical protein